MLKQVQRISPFNTFAQLTQTQVRFKRRGINFRKRLGVYSFKIKRKQYYKNPHALPLYKREQMKNADSYSVQRVMEAERESIRPFGQFTRKGGFKLNIDLVPFYNVPDLTDFKLKPYVPHSTPKIPVDILEPRVTKLPQRVLDLKLAPEVFEPAQIDEEEIARK